MSNSADAEQPSQEWNGVIDDIAEWACPDSDDGCDHYGQIGVVLDRSDSRVVLPRAIRASIARLDPKALVIQVTDALLAKWLEMRTFDDDDITPQPAFKLHINSYEWTLETLKHYMEEMRTNGRSDPTSPEPSRGGRG